MARPYPGTPLHSTDESDNHRELSHDVPPILVWGDKSSQPKFSPKTGLLTPPKLGPLGYTTATALGESKVNKRVVVDTRSPTVIAKGLGKRRPLGVWHTTDVDDDQSVASHPVPPPMCVA